MDFAEIARRVAEAAPDVLLVSFGCPKQEKWIAMHYHQLGVPVVMGVGATLDFIAGRMARAPALMQRSGTEWIYRLAQEPRRLLRRYTNDLLRFVPSLARQWWNLRGSPGRSGAGDSLTSVHTQEWLQVRVTGDLSAAVLRRKRGSFREVLLTLHHCQLDLSGVERMDSTGAAVLVQWRKRLHSHGKRFMLLDPSAGVLRTLRLMRLTRHFWVVARASSVPRRDAAAETGQPVLPPFPGGHTVAWQGEVTTANSEAVWGLTLGHFASVGAPPRQTFIIDLSRVGFIDSSGAELMGRLRAWARGLKKDLRFLGLRPDVCNVLRMAKLADLL
jgi:N-acetylglucosaminyldiphosphoundecaprenol N-acetyl-beta-D-mannosaminyltransferase